MFNGHGRSVPEEYKEYRDRSDKIGISIPDTIKLKPKQYVIMYKWSCPLRGASWLQNIIWNSFFQRNSKEFVLNLKNAKTEKDRIEFFEYYGSLDREIDCPNLILSVIPNNDEIKNTFFFFQYKNFRFTYIKHYRQRRPTTTFYQFELK